MKKVFFLMALLSLGFISAQAQKKYGHLNFNGLMAQMSETKAADSQLEAYQKQLVAKGEGMAKTFQDKVAAYYKEVQDRELTPKAQEEKEAALGKERDEILKYEQEVQQKLTEKRQELLKPIVEKAQKAIEEYAKANGYAMIFDTSVFNALLFAKDSDDLMPAIKAKLGIN